MSPSEIHDLIITLGSQILIIGTGLITVYYKMRAQVDKKLTEVKNHTDVSVQKLNGMLTYVIHSFDRPAWIKVATKGTNGETEFRMLEMNDLYAESYGIKRSDYIGKTDLEAGWDKSSADEFRAHDLMVWASGQASSFEEPVRKGSKRFRKIRLSSLNGEVKGIMAYAVDPEDPFKNDLPK